MKVKIISLADEARTIRRLEKTNKYSRHALRLHRINEVRSEARAALLAYAFLKGKAYKNIEKSAHTPPDWKRVEALVRKYCVNWSASYGMLRENVITHEQHTQHNSSERVKEILIRFEKWKE